MNPQAVKTAAEFLGISEFDIYLIQRKLQKKIKEYPCWRDQINAEVKAQIRKKHAQTLKTWLIWEEEHGESYPTYSHFLKRVAWGVDRYQAWLIKEQGKQKKLFSV